MPKQKIKRSVQRRFRVTRTGKVIFAHQYNSHLKSGKSKSRKRRQAVPGVLNVAFARKIKRLLGYL